MRLGCNLWAFSVHVCEHIYIYICFFDDVLSTVGVVNFLPI